MNDDDMRASDNDRQQVVDRLRVALDEGRLKMDEYMDRMGQAYEAVTYTELARLHSDLPAVREQAAGPAVPPSPAPAPARADHRGVFASLPTALRVLWIIWAVPVAINIVVWTLVCITTDHLVYPWPLWVAGPLGAALLAVTAGVKASQHGHRPNPGQLPPAG